MTNNEVVLRKSVVNKVLEIAQRCVDEKRKGWRVQMPLFWDAMDDMSFSGKEVRDALAFLETRMYVVTFTDEDGSVTGISLVPQRYQCGFCNMWLNMQDEPENHIDLCLRRQAKIERNRMLL
jgi:hypothetical protein